MEAKRVGSQKALELGGAVSAVFLGQQQAEREHRVFTGERTGR